MTFEVEVVLNSDELVSVDFYETGGVPARDGLVLAFYYADASVDGHFMIDLVSFFSDEGEPVATGVAHDLVDAGPAVLTFMRRKFDAYVDAVDRAVRGALFIENEGRDQRAVESDGSAPATVGVDDDPDTATALTSTRRVLPALTTSALSPASLAMSNFCGASARRHYVRSRGGWASCIRRRRTTGAGTRAATMTVLSKCWRPWLHGTSPIRAPARRQAGALTSRGWQSQPTPSLVEGGRPHAAASVVGTLPATAPRFSPRAVERTPHSVTGKKGMTHGCPKKTDNHKTEATRQPNDGDEKKSAELTAAASRTSDPDEPSDGRLSGSWGRM